MSLLVAINGQNYIIPEPNEVGWGSNLDDFFVAISNGVLQKTGGSFTLSAETDFGTTYGLKSAYYKSRATNVAATGAIRLANAETGIVWRNAAHDGDLALTVNSSNQLTFNGTPIESNALTSAHILVGNASNIATDVAMTGDISIDNAGLTAIGAGKIVNAQVNASAAIAYSKLALTGSIVNADVSSSAAIALSKLAALGTAKALQSNAATGAIEVSSVTNTELGYVSGVTSALQTQLDAKMPKAGGTFTGDVTYASGKGMFWTDSGSKTVKMTAPTTLTNTYALKWPLDQGGSNQYLTNDGSGNLSWTNAAGTGTVNSGTQYQLGYYATTTNAISGLTLITGSRALASDANGLPVAATTTATELGFVNGVTSAIQTQIDGKASTASVALKAPLAAPAFTGAVTFAGSASFNGSPVTMTGIDTVLQKFTASAAGSAELFLQRARGTSGSPTIVSSGDRLGTVHFLGYNGTGFDVAADVYAEVDNTPGASADMPGRLIIATSPDGSATPGTVATFKSTGVSIKGSTTNDAAAAGYVGEEIRSAVSGVALPTSTQFGDLTSISLTAGDWLVSGIANLNGDGGVAVAVTSFIAGISTTSGNSGTGLVSGDNKVYVQAMKVSTSIESFPLIIPSYRMSLSTTTTVYLKFSATYTTTTNVDGRLSAVRIR